MIGHQKSSGEASKRNQPCSIAEAEVGGACPDGFLIARQILDERQPERIFGNCLWLPNGASVRTSSRGAFLWLFEARRSLRLLPIYLLQSLCCGVFANRKTHAARGDRPTEIFLSHSHAL